MPDICSYADWNLACAGEIKPEERVPCPVTSETFATHRYLASHIRTALAVTLVTCSKIFHGLSKIFHGLSYLSMDYPGIASDFPWNIQDNPWIILVI